MSGNIVIFGYGRGVSSSQQVENVAKNSLEILLDGAILIWIHHFRFQRLVDFILQRKWLLLLFKT